MKNKWLFKADPGNYSFDRLVEDGGTVWDGVGSNAALKNLREVRKGDEILFYHTGDEKSVVGLMRAASDAYPDPHANDKRSVVVDVSPIRRLHKPVSLSDMKHDPKFADFVLIKESRLSVMPVPKTIWTEILKLSG